MRRGMRRCGMVLGLWLLAAFAIGHDFIVIRAGVVLDGGTVNVTVLIDQADLLAGLGENRLLFTDLAEVAAMGTRIAPSLEHGARLRSENGEIVLHQFPCLDVATAADKTVKPP